MKCLNSIEYDVVNNPANNDNKAEITTTITKKTVSSLPLFVIT